MSCHEMSLSLWVACMFVYVCMCLCFGDIWIICGEEDLYAETCVGLLPNPLMKKHQGTNKLKSERKKISIKIKIEKKNNKNKKTK